MTFLNNVIFLMVLNYTG